MTGLLIRPDLDDYEFYDPQNMQEYSYYVEKYIDYLEETIATKNEEIKWANENYTKALKEIGQLKHNTTT